MTHFRSLRWIRRECLLMVVAAVVFGLLLRDLTVGLVMALSSLTFYLDARYGRSCSSEITEREP